ncbi:uncharacterized protein LOC132726366 isoform X5 [Ruditapes philippinarum]|uniref:uncharacterized protein LOC132726366 isoform X5 n=1 Tax=Ruditapes philippinarum TaxID=129788 RepID=UPI00295BA4FC|nr:uncharacterized protein LOC132726366 isoform X5 [Ruditapes philippinarum]
MNVVMTSGKDGYVKVWSNQNELIREMNFATPIYASCFANERGDILVGFGTHICSVSLVNYLPLDYLKEVCSVSNFCTEDDVRELPVKFDHSSEPWLDICNLAHYSVDIVQRRRQRLEEEVIDKFKKATKKESAKFVIFVDGKTTRVIRKDFADRLLVWAKGKQKLKFGVKTVDTASLSTDISSNVKRKAADNVSQKKKNDTLRKLSRTGSSVKERKKTYFDSGGSLEIYPSAVGKALKELNQQKRLGAEEMRLLKEQELLKRDPIIAPDGYIPNSVIRKKLKTHGGKIDDALRKERPFQLKPVPKANPQHMPAWWAYEEEDKEQSTTYTWDSTSSEGLSRSKPTSGQRSYTNLSESSTLKAGKTKPGTPTAYKMISPSSLKMTPLMKAEVKSKRIELSRLDYDSRTSGRRSGAQSEAREKSFKLTNYAVDEDSSAIHVKESKSGRRLKSHMSHVIIQQLLQEEWMPEIGRDFELGDIINILVKVLSDQNNSDVYDKACTYVTNMFHELGLTEEQMDQIIGKLGVNLDNSNTAIKKFTLQTLQNIGQGRNDVLMLILPKLVDQDESIKGAAIEAIRVLTGAHDKETLLNFLESVGITSAEYRSREDQEYSLAMLAERFGEHEDPEVFHRIQNWVADTTPGLFDEDRDDDELWQDSRSRKEHSIMSEGKSVIDMYDTSGRNTMYADLPTTPGSYSDNDELVFSRDVSMHGAKSTGLKSEKSRFNARMDLLDRAGASVYPGERLEQPTPLSDLMGNDVDNAEFMMTNDSPFMQDPLLNFDEEPVKDFDEDLLFKERSDVSKGSAKSSPKSLDKLLLKERTLTDLSLVGPLPNFMHRDNTGRNFDEISTDSAFESAISVSEYDTSHFSEKWTMSHADQHSSKHSQISDENNMFDVEQISNLDFEGKKDGPLTPRSKGAASTFRKRMKETDGFSTISDRSSSSRKSRRSGSRQDLFSEVQSRASTEGMPLPYTLPSQARDSVLSRTPSGKSHLKISKKMSPKEDMLVTSEEPDETYIKSPDIEEEPVEIEAELGQVVEKAKTVGTEPTTVSMDTNTGSVDTQLVSKGTPANTPEAPFAKNEMDLFAQEVAVTNDNPYLEPITEDIENASFLKTPRNADSAIPMESTAIDKTGMGRANEGQKLSRYFTCGM